MSEERRLPVAGVRVDPRQAGADRGRRPVASVALELTAVCNQHCDYCYNEWREDGGKQLGPAAHDALQQRVELLLDSFDLQRVTLTGGEPLSHPAFFDVAQRFRDASVAVQVISNGTLITDKLAGRMAPLGLSYVQITLNGPDEALHAQHVGKGHFERTLRGIQALRRHGVTVVGCIVVTKKNCSRVHEILELWQSLGVQRIALSRFSPAGYAARHVAQLLPSVEELEHAFELADPFGKQMYLQCTMPVPPCAMVVERFEHIHFGVCPVGTSQQEFALGPDGRLRNCTLHGGAIDGVADILDLGERLGDLLDAPEVSRYREQYPDFCKGCVHLESCRGGCGAASQWVLGSRRKVDPLVAQHAEESFSAQLAFSRRNGRTHLEMVG